MNNRGYAISAIIYPLLLVCLILVLNILSDLENKKNILDRVKDDKLLGTNISSVIDKDSSGNEKLMLISENNSLLWKYQWYKDGEIISGATSNSYNVTTTGVYSLKITDKTGMSSTSFNYEVTNISQVKYNNYNALNVISHDYKNNTCVGKSKYYRNLRKYIYDSTTCNEKYLQNLFDNGYLEYKGNINAEVLKYDEKNNELYYQGPNYVDLVFGNYVEIDSNKSYTQTITMKSSDDTSLYIAGIVEYDVDYKPIVAPNVMWIAGSTTYLTKDLIPGDTVVYLNDTTNFQYSTLDYQLGFLIWNYTDSTGYTYPKETYSRNWYPDLYVYNNIDKTNNTITLKTAWTGPKINAGTYLSQSNSGGTFNYGILGGTTLSTSYKTYSNILTGTNKNADSLTKFRPGTKYIQTLILYSYSNSNEPKLSIKDYTFIEND